MRILITIEIKSFGYIYKLTCLVNGKIYIGKTRDFNRRRNEYRHRENSNYRSYNTPINRAITKYGFENFKMEIIHYAKDQESMDTLEERLILYHKSHDPSIGYNSRVGPLDSSLNYVTRRKMSEAHKGLKEKSSTKRKKSKAVYVYKDGNWMRFDSGKLFADYIESSKDMVSHAITKCMKIRGYYVFRENFGSEEKYAKLKDANYLKLYKEFVRGVETIENVEYID